MKATPQGDLLHRAARRQIDFDDPAVVVRRILTEFLPVDAALFALTFLVLPWDRALWSALGAAVLNLVIAINHRRDRYIV